MIANRPALGLARGDASVQSCDDRPPDSEVVVLVHGLAAPRLSMNGLASCLASVGFSVRNWGYRSLWFSIEQHATLLREYLHGVSSEAAIVRVHLVTHSMGSIVARSALQSWVPDNLGRIVMLGPPNHGSHVARRLATSLGWICPPLRELSDDAHSLVRRLPDPTDVEIGIIAAAEDRVVPRSSTILSNQSDWILLPGHHGALPWRRQTAEQVLSFLRHGHFVHNSP